VPSQMHARSLDARGRRSRRLGRRLGMALLLLGLAAGDSRAFVLPVDKIVEQVARANRSAGRTQSLVLSVALRDGDDRTLSQGELRTDVRGLARLELSSRGTSERYLLRGGEYFAARGGTTIASPAPYLPPLFLLQAGNGDRLLSGILSLGASGDETVLGRQDGQICYVIGGRDLAPPANDSAALFGSPGPKSAVWVARDDFRIVRIDHVDGTHFVLGPPHEYGDVTLPASVRIEQPGRPAVRLDILSARSGRFDLGATFGTDWLLGR
jgi:hypothetical protein